MATAATDDKETLARFPRRAREKGPEKCVRADWEEFRGIQLLNIRLWVRDLDPPGAPWRPTTEGVTFRPAELDELISVVQKARRLAHAQGLPTSPGEPTGPASTPAPAAVSVDPDDESSPF